MRLLRLDWIDRDGKLLILAGCVLAIPTAFGDAPLITDLVDEGAYASPMFWLLSIGGFFGIIPLTLFVLVFAEKVGRRRLLVLLTLMSAAAFVASVLTSNFLILIPFVLLAALGRGGGGLSPIQALRMASMANIVSPDRRTDLYAVFHIAVAVLPLVGLLVLSPLLFLAALFDDIGFFPGKALHLPTSVLLLGVALIFSRVSSGVEAPVEERKLVNPFRLPSRRVIFTLTGLLSLNSLAVAMLHWSVEINSSNIWSEEGRMGMFFTNLSASLFSSILVLPAFWLAAKLANRFGLVKTLVFTQMLSPLFLASTVLMPTGIIGVLLRVMFYVLGQMSAPLRASYMMGVVAPGERVFMAGIVLLGMSILGAIGPMFTGILADFGQLAISLFAGVSLVIVANAALYRIFRNVKPPEELVRVASDA